MVYKAKQAEAVTIRELMLDFRKEQTRCGIKKMYVDLKGQLQERGIKRGRDAMFDFARANDLLVKKTKLYHITTDSKHHFYKSPNLIRDILPSKAEQAFAADITYIKLESDWAYLALVTDLYSKKIMGYKLADNMKADMVQEALQMARRNCIYKRKKIIHHSDRGIQYCCPQYTAFAKDNGFKLSTTEQYDPYENAVAERINGILKYEFGLVNTIPNLEIAHKMVNQAVEVYNNKRRHWSLNLQTPSYAHRKQNHEYVSYKRGIDRRKKC